MESKRGIPVSPGVAIGPALVLDTEEVRLAAGDTVVQRGTNHAWSNRSSRPCTIAISSHDAA